MTLSATRATDEELVARWRDEPAPLLPLLHAFHDRDGYLSDDTLKSVAAGLRIPLADLYGTVTFYHHFAREEGGRERPRVCTGPICKLAGAQKLLDALGPQRATPMPCAGRCEDPIPVLRGNEFLRGRSDGALQEVAAPLPPPNHGGYEECCFHRIRTPGRASLEGYRATGGYDGLTKAVHELAPDEIIAVLDASGLAGRGGAGFPTGRKWRAVAEAEGSPKTIVCNADEGEPGCFKDRVLMDHDPHAVIEGMVIAARATGSTRGFIYLRYEYPHTMEILENAIEEARGAGLVGQGILGTDMAFELYVRRGAGAYICGEETSLLNSLEGKHPFPRNRPPYPVTHGYEDLPTVVNNVETLASVPHILAHGADWYAGLGLGDHKGTKIISLSGDIQRPGNYEVPLGLPLKTLLHNWAGGPREGHEIQAVTMAGLSGGFLSASELGITLDEPSLRAHHHQSFLGAGGIMVFDDSRDMVEIAREAMTFFAHESCGKCFPCRIGTQRLAERLSGVAGPDDPETWKAEVQDIGEVMASLSACGLGIAAPSISDSLLRCFPEAVDSFLNKARR